MFTFKGGNEVDVDKIEGISKIFNELKITTNGKRNIYYYHIFLTSGQKMEITIMDFNSKSKVMMYFKETKTRLHKEWNKAKTKNGWW